MYFPVLVLLMAGLILASGLTSLIYGVFFVTRQVSALRTVVKTASVVFLLLLVIVGVSGAAFSLLYLALAASALGDWLLAGEGERRFMTGVGAFAVAHGAYIPLFVSMGAWSQTPGAARLGGMVLLVLAASFLLFRVLWGHLGAMRWPLTGYFVIILAMGISALALPPGMGTGVILAGAALFILSDMVLGVELFRLSATSRWRPFTSRVIWFTYYSGQVLIALGTIMVAIVEVVF